MGYKAYSDSYLVSLTKAQELLRVTEHNFLATEEALNNSAKAGMEIAEKYDKAKELLKLAVEDLRLARKCQYCKHLITGYADICYRCHFNTNKWEWRYADEVLALIGEDTNAPAREDGAENG